MSTNTKTTSAKLLHAADPCSHPYLAVHKVDCDDGHPRYSARLNAITSEGTKLYLVTPSPLEEDDLVDLLVDLGCERYEVESKIVALYAVEQCEPQEHLAGH